MSARVVGQTNLPFSPYFEDGEFMDPPFPSPAVLTQGDATCDYWTQVVWYNFFKKVENALQDHLETIRHLQGLSEGPLESSEDVGPDL